MCLLMMVLVFLQATVLLALLQPAPETYELFDDILLLSEGASSCVSSASYIASLFAVHNATCIDWRQMRWLEPCWPLLEPPVVCRARRLPRTA